MLFPHVLLMLSASPRMSGFIFQVSGEPPLSTPLPLVHLLLLLLLWPNIYHAVYTKPWVSRSTRERLRPECMRKDASSGVSYLFKSFPFDYGLKLSVLSASEILNILPPVDSALQGKLPLASMTVTKLDDCDAHKNAFELNGKMTREVWKTLSVGQEKQNLHSSLLFLLPQARCSSGCRWCAPTSRTCRTGWNTWAGRSNTRRPRRPATSHSPSPATRSGSDPHHADTQITFLPLLCKHCDLNRCEYTGSFFIGSRLKQCQASIKKKKTLMLLGKVATLCKHLELHGLNCEWRS